MINTKEAEISFLKSAVITRGSFFDNEQLIEWIFNRRNAINVQVEKVPFKQMKNWNFDPATGDLKHDSGKFFSIEGLEVVTNWGNVASWTQPIINQPEIGFLGIIVRKIDGILHFLMQAKIEPGNINFVQLSPTLQATKSNYLKIHKGKSPLYLEYFNGGIKGQVLLDQLQSEQGARFKKKRNRNIIIEVFEDIPVYEDFCWLTLGQLKALMRYDNLINMDTRTVLSGISFGTYPSAGIDLMCSLFYQNKSDLPIRAKFLQSALDGSTSLFTIDEVISWITSLKSKYELEVKSIPLNEVKGWVRTEGDIHHIEKKYFSVIATNIHIGNREVVNWSQPLIESAQEGLIAFIVKEIHGILHFLVQAKVEAGNLDILEIAPTVQCLTGNYRKGKNEYEVPFINDVLNASEENIIYKSYQSEEGGRFYREQNLNMIVQAGDDFPIEVPENYCWLTLNQLFAFVKFNNYLNIQTRSLLSAIEY